MVIALLILHRESCKNDFVAYKRDSIRETTLIASKHKLTFIQAD